MHAGAVLIEPRTPARRPKVGEALGDDQTDIAGTSLDKGVELDAPN
jgi:hypothetical protein